MLFDQVMQNYGASATVNLKKRVHMGETLVTFITFSDDVLLLLWNVIFHLLKNRSQ